MITSLNIWDFFSSLKAHSEGRDLESSLSLDEEGRAYLCKDADGTPFFLIRSTKNIDRPAFKLRHVEFTFNRRYLVNSNSFAGEDNFARLICDSSHPNFFMIFIHSVFSVLQNSSSTDPVFVINNLLELFSRKTSTRSKTVQGLWGELLYIDSCTNQDDAVRAWHSLPTQLRDFVYSDKAVEVKTSGGFKRKHFFAIEQVQTTNSHDALCSILVERSDHGPNVSELAERICSRLSTGFQGIFWSKFLLEIDGLEGDFDEFRWNDLSARESIRFYPLFNLARPMVNEAGIGKVSGVRFELEIEDGSGVLIGDKNF